MKVPAFLLRRLYVTGSLRNTQHGWGFTLRNSIASGEATGLDALTLDGRPLSADACFFSFEGRPIPFSAVGPDRPFGLASGEDITITVDDDPLAEGPHTIGMAFDVPRIGRLAFDFTDEVA